MQAFSFSRIDNYFAIATRELAAALSCQRIAEFYRCFAGRYLLWVVMCGEGQITCGVYAHSFGPARFDSDYMRGPRLQTLISYRFTRPLSWSVYPANEGLLTYEPAEESVNAPLARSFALTAFWDESGGTEGCACAALALVVCPLARHCDLHRVHTSAWARHCGATLRKLGAYFLPAYSGSLLLGCCHCAASGEARFEQPRTRVGAFFPSKTTLCCRDSLVSGASAMVV